MRNSNTFAHGDQKNFLISDNHIRKYLKLSNKDKLIKSKQVWSRGLG